MVSFYMQRLQEQPLVPLDMSLIKPKSTLDPKVRLCSLVILTVLHRILLTYFFGHAETNVFCGWYTPWSGAADDYIGVDVCPWSKSSNTLYKMTYRKSEYYGTDYASYGDISVSARMTEKGSTVCVYYKVQQRNKPKPKQPPKPKIDTVAIQQQIRMILQLLLTCVLL